MNTLPQSITYTFVNKTFFYLLFFIFSLVILGFVHLITKHSDNTTKKIEIPTLITENTVNDPTLVQLFDGKEITYMDNVPVKDGNLSSKYGMRKDPFNGRKRMHHGIDIAARSGTKVYPLGKGTVIFAGRKSGYGNLVEILHGRNIISRYAHLKKVLVSKGQITRKTDVIALVGSTGRSTGPHLHLEIAINGKTINPEIFLMGSLAKR